MSNQYINEHNQLIELTANQQNAGLAKPSDFKTENRDGGQCGDTPAARKALLELSDKRAKSPLGERIPDRNEPKRAK
jgi:hypothetical protein